MYCDNNNSECVGIWWCRNSGLSGHGLQWSEYWAVRILGAPHWHISDWRQIWVWINVFFSQIEQQSWISDLKCYSHLLKQMLYIMHISWISYFFDHLIIYCGSVNPDKMGASSQIWPLVNQKSKIWPPKIYKISNLKQIKHATKYVL